MSPMTLAFIFMGCLAIGGIAYAIYGKQIFCVLNKKQDTAMSLKEKLVFAVMAAICLSLILSTWFYKSDYPLEESKNSTTLPLVTNEWKVIKIDQGNNSTTSVLELEHGWLVYRQNGFGGGMAFVPKQNSIK